METAALCKPIQRSADLLRIPGTWVLTGLVKLLAVLGSFPQFRTASTTASHTSFWRFLECQSIEATLTQNGHLTHHEIPSVASLRPGGHFPRIGWPVSPEYAWDAQHSSDSLPLPAAQFRRHPQQPNRTPQLAHLGRKALLAAPLVAGLRPGLACGCLQRRLEVCPPEALHFHRDFAATLPISVFFVLLEAPVAGHRRQALAAVGNVARRVESETVAVNLAAHHPNRKTGTRLALPVMVARQPARLLIPAATGPPVGELGNQSSFLVRMVGRDHIRVAAVCIGGSFVAIYYSIFRCAKLSSSKKGLGIPD